MKGLIHVYCGDGKGKTTAAIGLAVRATGAGKKVLFVQFYKDGQSSEIPVLQNMEGVETLYSEKLHAFFWNLSPREQEVYRKENLSILDKAVSRAAEADVLILDESIGACRYSPDFEKKLLTFLDGKPEGMEVVLTGRNPSDDIIRRASYVSQMQCVKHPYTEGVAARKGIED